MTSTIGSGFGNMDMLKSQIMTMMALKGGDTEKSIFTAIYAIMLISIIDAFFKYLPIMMKKIEEFGKYYLDNKLNTITMPEIIGNNKTNVLESSITLIRNYKDNEKDTSNSKNVVVHDYELVDAAIDYICSLDNTTHLRFINKYYINTKDEIIINKDIKAKMDCIEFETKTNQIEFISIKIYSETLKISDIKLFLEKIHNSYRIEKSNNLGSQRYFFNELHIEPMKEIGGGYRYETAPKRLTFTMTPFNTFKNMNNIFGSHVKEVRDRVNLFINNSEWYEKRGIPYTLGILLHGNPGCGKTSLIKAIAKETNRHVINITIRKTTTQSQLLNLFFNENIIISKSSSDTVTIAIPLDKRIYVIEDADCMTDIVLDRKYLETIKTNDTKELLNYIDPNSKSIDKDISNMIKTTYLYDENKNDITCKNSKQEFSPITGLPITNNVKNKNEENKDELTLSFLLNLLDGVLETPGRILIMTSNYPKRLDKALIRPGRIDVNVHVKNADVDMIIEIICHFYNITDDNELMHIRNSININLDQVFSPAEIIAILCNNYKSYINAINEMECKMKQKENENEQLDNIIKSFNTNSTTTQSDIVTQDDTVSNSNNNFNNFNNFNSNFGVNDYNLVLSGRSLID
jgi:hypothetical protein